MIRTTSLQVDHAVIAVPDLEAAAGLFAALGFHVTPPAAHSARMGTANCCVMLPDTYLELADPEAAYILSDVLRGAAAAALPAAEVTSLPVAFASRPGRLRLGIGRPDLDDIAERARRAGCTIAFSLPSTMTARHALLPVQLDFAMV
jgi:GNAT superfamily N-acetyltransferase